MSTQPALITSRDNPFIKALRRLAQDSVAYRKQGQVWLEGDHLCRAALQRGLQPATAVFSESFWAHPSVDWSSVAIKNIVISDRLFAEVSGLESPAPMGFLIDLPLGQTLLPDVPTVVLDRVQDAGNVGSILRSAGAFGFRQVVALKGTAALWSPKVLRAGMGAHFGLHLIEGVEAGALDALGVPLVVTSSHQGEFLHERTPPFRLGVPATIRRTQCFCLFREPSRPPSWRSQTARSLSAIRSEPPAPPSAKWCSTPP
jgi:TrmH family RNA methyltransferase